MDTSGLLLKGYVSFNTLLGQQSTAIYNIEAVALDKRSNLYVTNQNQNNGSDEVDHGYGGHEGNLTKTTTLMKRKTDTDTNQLHKKFKQTLNAQGEKKELKKCTTVSGEKQESEEYHDRTDKEDIASEIEKLQHNETVIRHTSLYTGGTVSHYGQSESQRNEENTRQFINSGLLSGSVMKSSGEIKYEKLLDNSEQISEESKKNLQVNKKRELEDKCPDFQLLTNENHILKRKLKMLTNTNNYLKIENENLKDRYMKKIMETKHLKASEELAHHKSSTTSASGNIDHQDVNFTIFKTVAENINVQWKILFRELICHTISDPNKIESCIHEITYANQSQLFEQAYQSLLRARTICGETFNKQYLIKCLVKCDQQLTAQAVDNYHSISTVDKPNKNYFDI